MIHKLRQLDSALSDLLPINMLRQTQSASTSCQIKVVYELVIVTNQIG